ncbi:MAG TPA: phosphatase PAP2 family protein [Acidimicrobiales bacterium]|nr:phosphatase PAP2 family protein [Acidimicrobiales bacterium]
MTLHAEVRPSRRAQAVAGVLVAADLLLFTLIAEDVLNGGGLVSHDHAVLAWFVAHRTAWLINASRFVSTVGGFASLAIISALLGLWVRSRGWPVVLAASALVSLTLASLASTAAKAIFDRPRPPVALHAMTVTLAAFPSGHATDAAAGCLAGAATLALTLARRRWAQGVLLLSGVLAAALVGISRLVLAVHWLSDVVAGWALGSAIAIAVVMTTWYVGAGAAAPRQRSGASLGMSSAAASPSTSRSFPETHEEASDAK